jgi:hypothetical protein
VVPAIRIGRSSIPGGLEDEDEKVRLEADQQKANAKATQAFKQKMVKRASKKKEAATGKRQPCQEVISLVGFSHPKMLLRSQ